MDYTFNKDHKLTASFLKKNFYKMNYSLSNPRLDYWIVLPNFVKEFSTIEKRIEGIDVNLIGQYISNDATFFDVEVFYEHLDFDINPSDWLIRKITKLKETVIFKNDFKDRSTGIYADILTFKETLGADRFISRITVKKNFDAELGGANYIGVRVMCREEAYNDLADLVLHTSYNWNFKNKGTWQLAERILPIGIMLTNKLTFYTFESWRVFGEEASPLNRLVIRQVDNKLNKGAINIFETKLLSDHNAKEVLDKFINRVTLTSIQLDELEDVSKSIYNPKIESAWTTQGIIKNTEEQFEAYFMAYLIQTKNSGYYFESLGSSPNYENYNWEINKRQLEMILESFDNPSFEQDREKKDALVSQIIPKIDNDHRNDFQQGSIFF